MPTRISNVVLEAETSGLCLPGFSIALAPLVRAELASPDNEQFLAGGLDRDARLLTFATRSGGSDSVDGALLAVRQAIADAAVCALLIAHNHPCGTAAISEADFLVTRRIAALARLAGVSLIDHLIIAGDRIVSFRALGLL